MTYLIHSYHDRQERANDNRQAILNFLRTETYSSTNILKGVVHLKERGTRRLLTQMIDEKLLAADEVTFLKSRALRLWGITPTGLLSHLTDRDDIKTIRLKHHTPGRVSPITVEHTLLTQQVRLWCGPYATWVPTAIMPGHDCPRGHKDRWVVYPDGLEKDRHDIELSMALTGYGDEVFTFAHEIERSRKTPRRYVRIIDGHIKNMQKQRYYAVCYWCENERAALSLKALFVRLIQDNFDNLSSLECCYRENDLTVSEVIARFRFKTYG